MRCVIDDEVTVFSSGKTVMTTHLFQFMYFLTVIIATGRSFYVSLEANNEKLQLSGYQFTVEDGNWDRSRDRNQREQVARHHVTGFCLG
jgi:hypothetical protein